MKDDDNIIGWYTSNGRHIPIREGESAVDKREREIATAKKESDRLNSLNKPTDVQAEHDKAVKELSKDKYPDGTYDVKTMKPVEYDDGYQVTFCQIGDSYSSDEYAGKVYEFLRVASDGKVLAGKFEGTPEISFHVASRAQAIALAKKYNQISIWDWKNCDEIKTGGTGRRK